MSIELIHRFVWEEAGFGFRRDGIYLLDFGWEQKIAEWTEVDSDRQRFIKEQ